MAARTLVVLSTGTFWLDLRAGERQGCRGRRVQPRNAHNSEKRPRPFRSGFLDHSETRFRSAFSRIPSECLSGYGPESSRISSECLSGYGPESSKKNHSEIGFRSGHSETPWPLARVVSIPNPNASSRRPIGHDEQALEELLHDVEDRFVDQPYIRNSDGTAEVELNLET